MFFKTQRMNEKDNTFPRTTAGGGGDVLYPVGSRGARYQGRAVIYGRLVYLLLPQTYWSTYDVTVMLLYYHCKFGTTRTTTLRTATY